MLRTSIPAAAPAARAGAQERVTVELRDAILAGRWVPGQKLPPERELAAALEVSRLTLRGALATLAAEGLVRPRQGSGVEVLDHRRTASLDLFSWLIAQPPTGGERSARLFAEVVRIRRVLAVDTLVQAAARASAEQIRALEALAAAQSRRVGEPAAYLAGDAEYSRQVIRVAGSTALELLFNSLQRALKAHENLVLEFMGPLAEHVQTYPMVAALLRHADPSELRNMAEAALDFIEAKGLQRVRRYCRRVAAAAPAAGEQQP